LTIILAGGFAPTPFNAEISHCQEETLLISLFLGHTTMGPPLYLWTREMDYIEVLYADFRRIDAVVDTIKAFRKQKTAVTA
jgi:hypothetical protein